MSLSVLLPYSCTNKEHTDLKSQSAVTAFKIQSQAGYGDREIKTLSGRTRDMIFLCTYGRPDAKGSIPTGAQKEKDKLAGLLNPSLPYPKLKQGFGYIYTLTLWTPQNVLTNII